jgi:hypothetical protein
MDADVAGLGPAPGNNIAGGLLLAALRRIDPLGCGRRLR